MEKYFIIENSIELPAVYYNGHENIKITKYTPGCSLQQQDQYPKIIKEFSTLESALQELKSEKYKVKKTGKEYTEYLVEIRTDDTSEYYFKNN